MNVLIAGDFSPMNKFADLLERDLIKPSDICSFKRPDDVFILNFETTISQAGFKKIHKVGPHLCCSAKVIPFIKKMGINAVTLANNHTMDYGYEGLALTKDLLNKHHIAAVGAGADLKEAQDVLYLRKKEETVAIINCCEHEFSYAENGYAGTNPLNPIEQYYSIQEAKRCADYVVVIVHGGHEHFNLPSPRMVQTYRFFVDAGADAVVNHHQHCFSGYEYYKGKPIYYGLGNYCFDWPGRSESFYKGYCVRLVLGETISSEEIPYKQCYGDTAVTVSDNEEFRNNVVALNDIIKDEAKLEKEVNLYYKSRIQGCNVVLSPFTNKYIIELIRRGCFPSMISKKKKKLLKAYVDCESHRDVMLNYLKKE